MMDIRDRQKALSLLHYYTLTYTQPPRRGDPAIDGIPGPAMEAAIRLFQKDNSLKADGLWGPKTEAAARLAIYENRCRKAPEGPDNPQDIPQAVHDYLEKKGLPPAAIGAVMGNISAESAMNPINLEDQYEHRSGYTDLTYTQMVDDGSYKEFATDRFGYGLCQWTWDSRKLGLLTAARMQGVSIGSLQLQLDYLWRELKTHWPSLLRQLMSPDISLWAATEAFMKQFENPKDQSQAAVQGRVIIAQHYYDRYCR